MKTSWIKLCSISFVSALILVSFQNCQPIPKGQNSDSNNQSSIGGNALECAAPWDAKQSIANGTSLVAFSSASVVEGMQCISEQRVCHDGVLSGSFENETCQVLPLAEVNCVAPWNNGQVITNGSSVKAYKLSEDGVCVSETRSCANGTLSGSYNLEACPAPQTKVCKVNWASGASASTKVVNAEACLAYYQEIKKNNPSAVFSQVDFDGKPILVIETITPVKKDTYKGYFIEKGQAKLFIETKNISEADALANCKKNSSANPKYGMKCTWGTKVILQKSEPATSQTCKVTFKSGASAATKVSSEAACMSYYKEIKKNNPNNPIQKVELGSKKLL